MLFPGHRRFLYTESVAISQHAIELDTMAASNDLICLYLVICLLFLQPHLVMLCSWWDIRATMPMVRPEL